MARLRISHISVHTYGLGSPRSFVSEAIRLSAAYDGAKVTLTIKGLPVTVTNLSDEDEVVRQIENSTGLLGHEDISLFGSQSWNEAKEDSVVSIHFASDAR